jgi:soluble lytic murein transglycosylase-like protein
VAKRRRRRGRARRRGPLWQVGLQGVGEAFAILVTALVLVTMALGQVSARFAGDRLWSDLLPFAATVLAIGVVVALLLRAWLWARVPLVRRDARLPVAVAGALATVALGGTFHPTYREDVSNLRRAVGGSSEAQRTTLAHQVFAAYRRTDPKALERLVERAHVFEPLVQEASEALGVDGEVLMGVAAAESGFLPRDSADGGHGLFQITAPPADAVALAKRRLGVSELDLENHRHNAYLAAATLRLYFDEMHGDPFLALLAYNIGPRNGGLATIMRQYGATDFVTVQPYLQNLPRDYPVRVLAAALAYRIARVEGKCLRYEDGDNARRIQAIGIPGLSAEETLVGAR